MRGSTAGVPDFQVLLSRLISSGQWDRAWEFAQEWLCAEPENWRAHLAAGQAAIRLKRYAQARPHIDRVLAIDPDNSFAHRLLSILQFNAGQFGPADESIRKAISLAPNDPSHWYHLAWMCHRQGSLAAARSCLEKARELSPNDPDIINLQALCEPDSPKAAERKFQHYRQALELNAQNADVHNNLGVHYLDVEKDLQAAEACFRRSLSLNPASVTARKNLFLTLKRRDPVFRTLHAPWDLLNRGLLLFRKSRGRYFLLFLLILPIWVFAAPYVMGAAALWFLFFWPLVKVYERLTLGDLRAKVGEIGARKGLLGYHRWPLRVRLGIFSAFLVTFWGGMAYACWRWPDVFKVAVVLLVLGFCLYSVRLAVKRSRVEAHGKKRAKIVQSLLSPNGVKKPWWNFIRRKAVLHD
jgi:Flp pilus assembly protein TadD